jgi:hypothetical protein
VHPYASTCAPVSPVPRGASVRASQAEQRVGVEGAPVVGILPHAPYAFTRVEHEAARRAGPRLRGRHLASRPFDAVPIDDHMRKIIIGGFPMVGEDMAV